VFRGLSLFCCGRDFREEFCLVDDTPPRCRVSQKLLCASFYGLAWFYFCVARFLLPFICRPEIQEGPLTALFFPIGSLRFPYSLTPHPFLRYDYQDFLRADGLETALGCLSVNFSADCWGKFRGSFPIDGFFSPSDVPPLSFRG